MSTNPATFFNVLTEFIANIVHHFPYNEGAKTANEMISLFANTDSAHVAMVKMWYEQSAPVLDDVKTKNPEPVANALDNAPNKIIAGINTKSILCNPDVSEENKEAVWKYIQTLTALSQMIYPAIDTNVEKLIGELPQVPRQNGNVPAQAPSLPTSVPTTGQVPSAKPKPAEVIKSITSAMPEIFKSINDLMKQGGDDNPLGQMMSQMMNPNQMQSGLAPNLAANMMDNDPGSVMQQVSSETGLDAKDIMKKLKRLELYEKARAKRNSNKTK
jgi:hypothetical protein